MKNPKIKRRPYYIRGDKVKIEHIDWLWPNRIPLKMLSLLVGIGGTGKSTLSLYMAAQITRGRPFADETTTSREPGDVIIISAEDAPGNVIIPRLMAMEADTTHIFCMQGVISTLPDGTEGITSLENLSKTGDLDMLLELLDEAPNPKLVIIDPYTAYMGKADSNSNTEVRGFLRPLSEIAIDYNISVLGITHLNKNQDLSADFRVLGSVGQQNAARMAWLVATDPDDFNRRYFVWMKGNLAPRTTGLAYHIMSVPVSTPDGRSSDQPTCAFEKEPVTLTADELLAPRKVKSPGAPRKQGDAREWLESTLSEGPVDSKLIFEEGEILGYSSATLNRVKSTMGIMSIPIREKNSMKVIKWEWRLRSPL